jgi:hypothetical protein
MLIKTGISPFLWECLRNMQKNPLFDNYYLVGGTALSLQIGHRVSDDIDLFTKDELNKDAILFYAKKYISNDYKIINNSESIFQLFSDAKNLKLDFVHFPYALIDPLIMEEGIRMVDKNDLSAMKMSATGTRGSEAKDFVDIIYLLQYMSFEKIVENFKLKYKTDDILHYLRSVAYFDEIKKESWLSLKPIKDKISSKTVVERLSKAVSEYQNNILSKI